MTARKPPKSPSETRAYMREYMRRYRAGEVGFSIVVPNKPQSAGAPSPAVLRRRELQRARYPRIREAVIARARAWDIAHPEEVRARVLAWRARHRTPCPFCGFIKRWPSSTACLTCQLRFGYGCRANPACGVQGYHKHCPCGMAVMRPKTRRCVIEPCGYCLAEMERLSETLAGLYKRAESFEEKKKGELAA